MAKSGVCNHGDRKEIKAKQMAVVGRWFRCILPRLWIELSIAAQMALRHVKDHDDATRPSEVWRGQAWAPSIRWLYFL